MCQVVDIHNGLVDQLCRAGERAWSEASELPGTRSPTVSLRRKASTDSTHVDGRRDSLLSAYREEVPGAGANSENVKYLELVIGFSAGMVDWMVASKRYVVSSGERPKAQ